MACHELACLDMAAEKLWLAIKIDVYLRCLRDVMGCKDGTQSVGTAQEDIHATRLRQALCYYHCWWAGTALWKDLRRGETRCSQA